MLCGQALVATLAEVTLQKACDVIGHERGTTWAQLRDALRRLDVLAADCLVRVARYVDLPMFCIVRLYWNKEESHWLLRHDEVVYDPSFGMVDALRLPFGKAPFQRITSYGRIGYAASN